MNIEHHAAEVSKQMSTYFGKFTQLMSNLFYIYWLFELISQPAATLSKFWTNRITLESPEM